MTVRPAKISEAAPLADIYLNSFRAACPTIKLVHNDADVRRWFRDHLLPETETWVATGVNNQPVGFISLSENSIEQFYLEPGHQHQGIGTQLLELAKRRRPTGLRLFTFQINHTARRFYEHHGFRLIDLNDGSRNEEHEPDARYEWQP